MHVVWHVADFAISVSATRNRSECIAVGNFIKQNTSVKLSCAKQGDSRIRGTYRQFWQPDAKCTSLDAKIVTKVQKYIDLTFDSFNFDVVGRSFKFFAF